MDDLVRMLQSVIEKELMTEELFDLDSGVYTAVSSRIKEMKESYRNGTSSIGKKIMEREIELLSSLVGELLTIRIVKFFSNSLKGKNDIKLTIQEKYVVDPILDSIKRLQKLNEALKFGFSRYLENLPRQQRYTLIKFLKSIDKFIGSDFKNYGPFEKGDLSLIPIDNAKILIDKNIAEDVGVV